MPVSHPVEEIRFALQAIVASEAFTRSQQLSRLIRYLCDALIAGDAERLSEYAIGTEALGRPADFDPTQDAAVRVEMHRLRRRLRDYYAREGANDLVRIDVPAGRYAPVITRVADEQKQDEPAPSAGPELETLPSASSIAPSGRFPIRRGTAAWAVLATTLLVVIALALPWRRPAKAVTPGRGEAARGSAALPTANPALGVRIGCGRSRPWTDRLGQIWGPDEYFEGGESTEIPARSYIAGAFDAHLFQSARTGTFSYRVPLPARTYEMRLYFIEPVFGPESDQGGEGNRLFSIAINGQKVLDRFDILADADGPWIADVRAFKDISPGADGYVRLDFQNIVSGSSPSGALLNAIEFVPARPHVLNPVRMLPQDNFYTDSAGILWTPDNYGRGGRVAVHPGPLNNTLDKEIFRHERYGRFRYAVPVDRGFYSVYLYMAEEYWGSGNPGGGGVGTRVFNVFCNGVALLRDFDLYKESGINHGVVRAFHHVAPNAQGKLLLSFEPEHDYASLYGLEVLDEAGGDTPSCERTVSGACAK